MQKYTASVITAGCLWGLMGLFTRTLATYGVDSTGAIALRPAGQKARHIRAFDGPRPRADADGRDVFQLYRRAECLHQLRQPLDMRKQRVRLPQPQLSRLHVQKA